MLFVPENITLDQLLNEFKRRNKQIAVVVDEHGGTSGLITLANVVSTVHLRVRGVVVCPARSGQV